MTTKDDPLFVLGGCPMKIRTRIACSAPRYSRTQYRLDASPRLTTMPRPLPPPIRHATLQTNGTQPPIQLDSSDAHDASAPQIKPRSQARSRRYPRQPCPVAVSAP